MTNVVDWILDLFRDPVQAQAFIADPDRSMANAGVQNVSAAQVNAVAASVAPAAVIQGGGNPVHGLQQAVAQTHGIAFAPQHQTEAFSNNDVLSHNDTRFLSPQTNIDKSVDLEFGDVTFGDKTTNTATNGGVVNTGNADDILTDGSVKQTGDHNTANTGDIETGDGSPVVIGEDNDVRNTNQDTDGGDIIQNNDGPVVKTGDIDTSGGGASGGDGGHGGILGGGGNGGAATGGAGGDVIISPTQTTTTNTGGGDVTNVEVGGDVSGGIDASHDDNSSNSHNTDNSTHDSHDDNSVDNSVDQDVNQGGIDIF
jgi:hypothetical protein